MAVNSPKHTQETWTALKSHFVSGSYKTLKELSAQYGVHPNTLRSRIWKEKWSQKQSALLDKVERTVEKQVVSKAEAYLSRTSLRMEKYEKIIDASIEQGSSKTVDNVPLLDAEQIDQYTRSETRLKDISAFCYRLASPVQEVAHSGTLNLQHSLVKTIEALRNGKELPTLTDEDKARLVDVEIVDNPS